MTVISRCDWGWICLQPHLLAVGRTISYVELRAQNLHWLLIESQFWPYSPGSSQYGCWLDHIEQGRDPNLSNPNSEVISYHFWCIYILLDINLLFDKWFQVSLPICRLPFHFVYCLLRSRGFYAWCSITYLFMILFFVLWCHSQKTISQINVKECLPFVFF